MSIDPVVFVIRFLIVVISLSVHEFAHAWSAMKLGDRTAEYHGRLTLNPMAHLDPVGTMMILVSSMAGFGIGWAKPVPVDPHRLRYGPRVGFAITAAAGPAANLLQAMLWAIPLRLWLAGVIPSMNDFFIDVFFAGVVINISLALFNLLPLFPLDGEKVLQGILSLTRARWAYDIVDFLDQMRAYGPMLLLGLIFFDQMMGGIIFGTLLGSFVDTLWRLFVGV